MKLCNLISHQKGKQLERLSDAKVLGLTHLTHSQATASETSKIITT
jgi:hypothetical protein